MNLIRFGNEKPDHPDLADLQAVKQRCRFEVVQGRLCAICSMPLPGGKGDVTLMASAPLGPLYRVLLARLGEPAAAARGAAKLAATSAVQKVAETAKRVHGNLAPLVEQARREGPEKLQRAAKILVAKAQTGDPRAVKAVANLRLAARTQKLLDDKGREAAAKLAPAIEKAKRSPEARQKFVRGIAKIRQAATAGVPKAKAADTQIKLAARYRTRMAGKAQGMAAKAWGGFRVGGWAWNVPYRTAAEADGGRLRSLYRRGLE